MFRTLSTIAVAGSALAALAFTGVGAANAASTPTAVPAKAPQQVTTQQNPMDAPAGWVLRDKYWHHGDCVEAGQDGIQRQHWEQFQCANGTLQWVLWTNR